MQSVVRPPPRPTEAAEKRSNDGKTGARMVGYLSTDNTAITRDKKCASTSPFDKYRITHEGSKVPTTYTRLHERLLEKTVVICQPWARQSRKVKIKNQLHTACR